MGRLDSPAVAPVCVVAIEAAHHSDSKSEESTTTADGFSDMPYQVVDIALSIARPSIQRPIPT